MIDIFAEDCSLMDVHFANLQVGFHHTVDTSAESTKQGSSLIPFFLRLLHVWQPLEIPWYTIFRQIIPTCPDTVFGMKGQ